MVQRRGDFAVDRRPTRDRIYREATSGRDGRRGLGAMALAVSVFLLMAAVSIRQVTAQGPARDILESGIALTTEIDQVIAEDHDTLREMVESDSVATYMIPDYPLDVVLTRDEVLKSSDAELRRMVLERSSGLVYAGGLEAFDRTGSQSFGRFSSQGLLEMAVGQVSAKNHARAGEVSIVLLLATAVAASLVVLSGEGWGRLRGLGLALAGGTLPGIAIVGLAWVVVGRVGGTDPFVADLRAVVQTVLQVPFRNYAVTFGLGALLAALGIAIGTVDSRLTSREEQSAQSKS